MLASDVVKKDKPAEKPADGCAWARCSKCSGTGIFARGVLNGALVSNTGFCCYRCNGTGWTQRARPVRKAKAVFENTEIPF
jgi:DnaJ-class molecular chaperone